MSLAALVLSLAIAQAAPSTPPPASAPAPGAPGETYTYEPGGRRDPFLNLLDTGTGTGPIGKKGQGVAGMVTGEISVRGVMQNGSTLIALVIGPDKKTYIVKAGDKLLDGTIKSVNEQGLVIVQSVNDPLSLDKTREVRKILRSAEDAKQ
jgi:Tfp pilus assembly protein PilP